MSDVDEKKIAPTAVSSGLDDGTSSASTVKMAISSQINLNVGGALFSTTVGTLRMQKDSFFDLMFSGRFPIAYDSEKRIFIDRDSTHFRHILNYLRQAGRGWTPENLGLSKAELWQLRDEAEFYQIDPIVKRIDAKLADDNEIKTVVYICDVGVNGQLPTSVQLAVQHVVTDGFDLNSCWAVTDRPCACHHAILIGNHFPSDACMASLKHAKAKGEYMVVTVAHADECIYV